MITEVLMASGRFDVALKPTMPRRVINRVTDQSMFAVTPARIFGPVTASDILGLARFAGIVREWGPGRQSFSGPSILDWLGDPDGKGPKVTEALDTTSGPSSQLTDLFDPASNVNGLTLGTTTGVPSAFGDFVTWTSGEMTPRQFIEDCCAVHDLQFRVNPDLSVDIRPRGDLFVDTPTVLLTDAIAGRDLAWQVVSGDIAITYNMDDFADEVRVSNDTYSGSAVGLVSVNGADGNTGSIYARVTSSSATSNTQCSDQAAVELLTNLANHWLIDVSLRIEDPRRYFEPGDTVAIYQPSSNFVNVANPIVAMGQTLFPVEISIEEMSWAVTRGMGVWLIDNDDQAVIDITDFVVFEEPSVSLKVGARWRTLEQIVLGRI